jgi:hypothetical protein
MKENGRKRRDQRKMIPAVEKDKISAIKIKVKAIVAGALNFKHGTVRYCRGEKKVEWGNCYEIHMPELSKGGKSEGGAALLPAPMLARPGQEPGVRLTSELSLAHHRVRCRRREADR